MPDDAVKKSSANSSELPSSSATAKSSDADLIEKVAAAIYERPSAAMPRGRPGAWHSTPHFPRKKQVREDARAALQAMGFL